MLARRMRHHIEAVTTIFQLQQIIAFTNFGDRFFHNHRLRSLSRHFQHRMQTRVVFIIRQCFRIFPSSGIKRAVRARQSSHNTAKHYFLTQIFLRFRISDVFSCPINQITAGFGDFVSINTFTFGINQPIIRPFNQTRRMLRLHLINNLRMLHEHPIKVYIDGLDTVARTHFAHTRRQFYQWDVTTGSTLDRQARMTVYIAQNQYLTGINTVGIADFAAVCAPQTAPLPRPIQIFA